MTSYISAGHRALRLYADQNIVSLEYLEGVAKLRLSLTAFADVLSTKKHELSQYSAFIDCCRDLCTDTKINFIDGDNSSGPVIYLMKLLVQQYGLPTLKHVTTTCPWVIPKELTESKNEVCCTDMYKQTHLHV